MHIAICLWGLMRAVRFTARSFHSFVEKPLLGFGHSYDVFVHTYSFAGSYGSSRNHESEIMLNFSDWKLLRPNYIFMEDQDDFDKRANYSLFQSRGDPWHNNFSSFRNHMRALNSLYHVTRAVEEFSSIIHYDAIVFVRPDVQFLHPLPIFLLTPEKHPSRAYLPDFHRSCKGNEYNDRMAMAPLSVGLKIGKKLEKAFSYSVRHLLHAEKFTYFHISSEMIDVVEFPFRFRRIRASGSTHPRDFEAIRPRDQLALEKRGKYFVGHGKRTPWLMRNFYSLLEFLTAHSIYIWNHDDNGNVFCAPHAKITVAELLQMEEQLGLSTKRVEWDKSYTSNNSENERENSRERSLKAEGKSWNGTKFHCDIVEQSLIGLPSQLYGSVRVMVPTHCRIE